MKLSTDQVSMLVFSLLSCRGFTNYRDSKLTRILQNSLGGNAKTVIICTITTATVDETLSTLQVDVMYTSFMLMLILLQILAVAWTHASCLFLKHSLLAQQSAWKMIPMLRKSRMTVLFYEDIVMRLWTSSEGFRRQVKYILNVC